MESISLPPLMLRLAVQLVLATGILVDTTATVVLNVLLWFPLGLAPLPFAREHALCSCGSHSENHGADLRLILRLKQSL